MTLAEAEKTFVNQLKSLYQPEEAGNIIFLAINHVCGISKPRFLLNKNEPLSELNEVSLIQILNELKTGKPIQYVLGETEFYGLRFKVDPSVLIPRQETEELVEWVLKEVKSQNLEVKNVLDIGTGSGCIAISIKKHLPEAEVYGIDVSPGALKTSSTNALLNNIDVKFVLQDVLKDFGSLHDGYSIIISNPPYVTVKEKQQMHVNVLQHEPHNALFVPDTDPLIFYHRIINFAKTHLEPGGLLFFEINENSGKEIIDFLQQNGFSNAELRKDLRGKDRMIMAKLQ